jgi:hypothetical protein
VGNVDQTLVINPNLLYLQGGVMLEGSMKFDISFIPRGSTIISSVLYVERDPGTSWLSASVGDTLISAHLLTAEGTPPTFAGVGSTSTRVDGTPYRYKIEFTSAVQSWLRGPNYGLVLRMASPAEYQTMGLITIHSHSAPDPAKRPRLKIIYGTQAG